MGAGGEAPRSPPSPSEMAGSEHARRHPRPAGSDVDVVVPDSRGVPPARSSGADVGGAGPARSTQRRDVRPRRTAARSAARAREPIDRVIAQIAAHQHGVVSREQLLEAGIGRSAIDHRIGNGRLHRVHRGVYLVGHPRPAPHALDLAAVLACGDGAVRSHESAGAAWSLVPAPDGVVDIAVVGHARRRRPGIRLHRTVALARRDVRILAGVPTTAPARTLLDMAETVSPRRFERAFDEAIVRRLVREAELEALLDRSRGRRGAALLRHTIDRRHGPTLTRSEAEERFLELVRRAGLPAPRVNARVGVHEVDFLWTTERLIVETDGYAFHSSRTAFERDRLRDAELQAASFRVVRVTWRQLIEEPEAVLVRLAQALVTRPTRG